MPHRDRVVWQLFRSGGLRLGYTPCVPIPVSVSLIEVKAHAGVQTAYERLAELVASRVFRDVTPVERIKAPLGVSVLAQCVLLLPWHSDIIQRVKFRDYPYAELERLARQPARYQELIEKAVRCCYGLKEFDPLMVEYL